MNFPVKEASPTVLRCAADGDKRKRHDEDNLCQNKKAHILHKYYTRNEAYRPSVLLRRIQHSNTSGFYETEMGVSCQSVLNTVHRSSSRDSPLPREGLGRVSTSVNVFASHEIHRWPNASALPDEEQPRSNSLPSSVRNLLTALEGTDDSVFTNLILSCDEEDSETL